MTNRKENIFFIKAINFWHKKGRIYSLLDLVKEFHYLSWNFDMLCLNMNIKVADILKDKIFTHTKNNNITAILSNNLNIQITDIEKHDFKDTYYFYIKHCCNWTAKEFCLFADLIKKKTDKNAHMFISKFITDVEIIKKFPKFDWDLDCLFKNNNIEKSDLLFMLHKEWASDIPKREISFYFKHIDYNIEKLKSFPNRNWDWEHISEKMKLHDILSNPDLPWDPKGICLNSEIFSESLNKTSVFLNISFDEVLLSENKNLTITVLKREKHIRWDWVKIAIEKFTIKEILENLDLPWPLEVICQRDDFTFEIYKNHKTLFDNNMNCLFFIQSNPNIQVCDFGQMSLLIPKGISLNPNLILNDIINNILFPWDFEILSETLKVSLAEIIGCGFVFPWNWEKLSKNIKVTPEEVKTHINCIPWNFKTLSENRFFMDSDIFKKTLKTQRNKIKNIFPLNCVDILVFYIL